MGVSVPHGLPSYRFDRRPGNVHRVTSEHIEWHGLPRVSRNRAPIPRSDSHSRTSSAFTGYRFYRRPGEPHRDAHCIRTALASGPNCEQVLHSSFPWAFSVSHGRPAYRFDRRPGKRPPHHRGDHRIGTAVPIRIANKRLMHHFDGRFRISWLSCVPLRQKTG
jgi:hypothetical protein